MDFKMLIVDDEAIICRGLKDTIPWAEYNIEVADVAHDGITAIQKIEEHMNIDLVITDVKMPNMDGLELAKSLYYNYPDIRIIMISGYDEFSYAQRAIKLGVKDYLLKPVNIDELVNRVIKLKQDISHEREKAIDFLSKGTKKSILQQVSSFPGETSVYLDEYQDIKVYPFLSYIQDYMKVVRGVEDIKVLWKKIIDTTIKENGFDGISIFIDENTLFTAVLIKEENFSLKEILLLLKSKIYQNGYRLTFIASESIVTIAKLNDELVRLKNTIIYSHINEKENIVYPSTILRENPIQEPPNNLEKNLMAIIFKPGTNSIEKISDELFGYFKVNEYLLEDVVQSCNRILKKIIKHAQTIQDNIFEGIYLNYEQSIDVNLYNSYLLLQELFNLDVLSIRTNLKLKNIGEKDWMIERAKKYIKDYYKLNLKAHEVADIINISPNYFSSLFNQETGKGFNEYINNLRIEEAKTLLVETPFKVHEIAEMVGYKEYKYFVKVFKEFSNLTPIQYRKLMTMK